MKNYELPTEEKVKKIYSLMDNSINTIKIYSEKINFYIAYSCAFILVYFFLNLEKLKLIINKHILMIFICIPLIIIFLTLLQLYGNYRNEIELLKSLTIKQNYLLGIDTTNHLEKQKKLKIEMISKIQKVIEYLTIIFIFFLFIEIIVIFILLIY